MQANETLVPQAPALDAALPKGPTPLDPQLLQFVSGGGPRGTWESSEDLSAGPRGTWDL